MSRISRYQDSMSKFIKQKSFITALNEDIKNALTNISNENNHVISIMLLTIMNSQAKLKNQSIHGYYIASGVEYILYVLTLMENKKYYENKYSKKIIDEIITRLPGIVNVCMAQNIESIQNNLSESKNNNELNNLFKKVNILMRLNNSKIHNIFLEPSFEFDDLITKTDVIKYKFNNIDLAKQKITKLKKIKKENFEDYVKNRYGYACQLSVINGWLLGGGDDKNISALEKIGLNFGFIIKIVEDFINIEKDLDNAKEYTTNIVLNYGFQNCFELFIENKQKFIEGCMTLDIYGNTIKEIIDLLENKLDTIISDKSSPDLVSHYTLI